MRARHAADFNADLDRYKTARKSSCRCLKCLLEARCYAGLALPATGAPACAPQTVNPNTNDLRLGLNLSDVRF